MIDVRPTHSELVAALVKPGEAIIDTLTPEKADLLHMALGVAGEAGELVDAIKKFAIYNKDLDRENVKEELGDLLFYMRRIMQRMGLDIEDVEQANIEKLLIRYKGIMYSDKAAQERADK